MSASPPSSERTAALVQSVREGQVRTNTLNQQGEQIREMVHAEGERQAEFQKAVEKRARKERASTLKITKLEYDLDQLRVAQEKAEARREALGG